MNNNSQKAISDSMGQNGFKYLSTAGTATYATKRISAIQVIADCTLTAVAVTGFGDSLTAVTVLCGTVIVGNFSSVTCAGTGGALLAYLAERA